MPVIRISDKTMRRLKAWAEPLEDTAESALAKALDAAESVGATNVQVPPEKGTASPRRGRERGDVRSQLPQRMFREPLLKALHDMGGSARTDELRPVMKMRMTPSLLPGDLERISSGDERWWNATCWERSALVKEGYLRDDSPRGTWQLSEMGIEHVADSISASTSDPFVEHLLAIPDVGDDADFDRDASGFRSVEL